MTWRAWLSALLFLLSFLAVFRAFVYPLWFIALGITEWPQVAAILCTFPWWFGAPATKGEVIARCLSGLAVLLCLSPLGRMLPVARQLPEGLHAAFGEAAPRSSAGAPYRRVPFSWADFILGIPSPPAREETLTYFTGPGLALQMDLFRPFQTKEPSPVLIVVHGGSWQSGTRKEFAPLNRYLAARGYAVASIDYRLAPAVHFPGQTEDVQSAIVYLSSHADELGIDASQIVLLGRSAGGQIALWTAYHASTGTIRGVVALYSPADMEFAYAVPGNPLILNSRKVLEDYMGGPPSHFPDGYRGASALAAAGPVSPPTLMIHGLRDELVWPNHDDHLSARLKELGRPYYYLSLPWATHGCDYHFNGPSGQLTTYAIEQFLAVVTQKGESHP